MTYARRPVVRRFAVVLVAAALAGCGARRPVEAPPPPPAPAAAPALAEPAEPEPSTADAVDLGALYADVDAAISDYEAGVELLESGDEVAGEEGIGPASNRLRGAARLCARTAGCDMGRILDAFERLLTRQNMALKKQAFALESAATPDEGDEEEGFGAELEAEPGTGSDVVAAVPEIGKTVTLLKGTDLRDLITLNQPVEAAINDWLTWLRPMLLDSYENYRFLRDEVAPVYADAGLPEALLFAMMATETGVKVHAFSRAGAAGPLQFMRYTGMKYGLKTVNGFDQRLDPVAATRANVEYLNDQFRALNNSLEKALAAYNGGEGRIAGLQSRLGDVSFWDKRVYYALPRETREYVPRILAAAWLFLHPDDYGLELPKPDAEVTDLELERDASISELSVCLGQVGGVRNGWFRTLRNLNPRLEPGDRVKAGGTLRVPASLVEAYRERCLDGDLVARAAELRDAGFSEKPAMIPYVVRRGDTLGRIAARHRCVTIHELAAINRIRGPRYVIYPGQELKIPNCD